MMKKSTYKWLQMSQLLLQQCQLCNNSIVFSLSLNWCLYCINLIFFFVFFRYWFWL